MGNRFLVIADNAVQVSAYWIGVLATLLRLPAFARIRFSFRNTGGRLFPARTAEIGENCVTAYSTVGSDSISCFWRSLLTPSELVICQCFKWYSGFRGHGWILQVSLQVSNGNGMIAHLAIGGCEHHKCGECNRSNADARWGGRHG